MVLGQGTEAWWWSFVCVVGGGRWNRCRAARSGRVGSKVVEDVTGPIITTPGMRLHSASSAQASQGCLLQLASGHHRDSMRPPTLSSTSTPRAWSAEPTCNHGGSDRRAPGQLALDRRPPTALLPRARRRNIEFTITYPDRKTPSLAVGVCLHARAGAGRRRSSSQQRRSGRGQPASSRARNGG